MDQNQIIEIIADDPASKLDFAHFCEISNYQLIKTLELNSQIELSSVENQLKTIIKKNNSF